ncbi:MAG: YwqG family protein [Pseudomonadota bacterium]
MIAYLLLGIVATVAIFSIRALRPAPKSEEEIAKFNAEVRRLTDKLREHALESIKVSISPDAPMDSFASKFGGYAAWPADKEYPTDKRSKPLALLAQINLQDLPENTILPRVGLVQFFIAVDSSWGLEYPSRKRTIDEIIADPRGYRVVFHPEMFEETVTVREKFNRVDLSSLPFEGERAVTFELERALCSPSDYRFDKVVSDLGVLDEDVIDAAWEVDSYGGCRIGGYATFTQDDPRMLKPTEDWLLLFQMDSVKEHGFDIMWGDVGVANFFIRPSDLAALNFDRVWYNWDCC